MQSNEVMAQVNGGKKGKAPRVVYDEAIHGEAIRNMIKDVSNQLVIVESTNQGIKEIKARAKSECGMESKRFNKLLNIYHKQERERFENENDETLTQYDQLFKS